MGSESEAEKYDRWLAEAESQLQSNNPSNARAVLNLALRSNPLHPSDKIDRLAAIADVLLASENNPFSVLQLPPNPPLPHSVLSSYRRLSLLLTDSPFPLASQALSRVSAAYAQLSSGAAAARRRTKSSFWTLCEGCWRLHEYAMEHVGKRLRCCNCRQGFLAVELEGKPDVVEGTDRYRCRIVPVMKEDVETEAERRYRKKPTARKTVRPPPKKFLGSTSIIDEEDEEEFDEWAHSFVF